MSDSADDPATCILIVDLCVQTTRDKSIRTQTGLLYPSRPYSEEINELQHIRDCSNT